MGLAPYVVEVVDECDCKAHCTCEIFKGVSMDSDCIIRKVTPEHRQSLRRPPVISADPAHMAAVERELLPLLAARDRRWLESTGNVSATVTRLNKEYKRLVAPRKRLTKTEYYGSAHSPAVALSRLFPRQSDEELRSISRNKSLAREPRIDAHMALGDCHLLGVGRGEVSLEAALNEYNKAAQLLSGECAIASAIIHYLIQLPIDQRWSASLSEDMRIPSWLTLGQCVPNVCLFMLWQAKRALAAGTDLDPPLSNVLRSMVERAEDIAPIEFPPGSQQQLSNAFSGVAVNRAGGGFGGAGQRQEQGQENSDPTLDYKAFFKRAQISFAAGRFMAARGDFMDALNLLPPQLRGTPLGMRLRCQLLLCSISLYEEQGADADSRGIDDAVNQCQRMLANPFEPPDVLAQVPAMLRRARHLQALRDNALARTASEACAAAAAADLMRLEASAPVAEDDFLAEHEQMMSSRSNVGVSASQRRQHRESERERVNAARRSHSLASATRAEAAGEEELVMQGEHIIQTCEVLATGGVLALNGGDDFCPYCITPWVEFADSSALAVVLPCRHALCLSCLSQEWRACSHAECDTRFACGLCRGLLPPALVPTIAAEVLEQHSADSGLTALVRRLSMPERAQKALLESLLVLQDFDFSQVLAKLMDIVGSLGHLKPDLTSEQKQHIFAKERENEKRIWEQLTQVRGELDELAVGSAQGIILRKQLNMLHGQVRHEAAKAADEIFRQTNEVRSMAAETQGCVQLDLHGLSVAEALQKVQEVVLPVLPVVGFMLITGRGLHSRAEGQGQVQGQQGQGQQGQGQQGKGQQGQGQGQGGQVHSVLKAAVEEYLQERGLAVTPVPGNDGAIYVLCSNP
ncbi:hypothetical protein B484DRAFT_69896 [Ochromonadaceae sp. CCMP2298]|nr:hypothetical protein B484DRAFT_69896 [Ochromonadaceae sp. CCMP2298]